MFGNTLYKTDSKGKTRIWLIEEDGAKYRTIAGLSDGKQVISEWTIATPKNEGRANETTAVEQARLEIDAEYDKKVRVGGYGYTLAGSGKKYVAPMLAKNWDDEKLIVGHQVMFSQPKLDGFRCIADHTGLFSRKGDEYYSVPHIASVVQKVCFDEQVVFDGELYNHELKEDFNTIASIVRKKKPSAIELQTSEKMIQYHIYDIVDTSKPFSKRAEIVDDLFQKYPELNKYCKLVETANFTTESQMNELYTKYLESGYEGQMIRLDTRYETKRSKNLLKRKEFQDAEFKISGIEAGLGNRSGMAGRVTCSLPDGRTFGAGISGGLEVNRNLWKDKESLIGQLATIQFFNYTPDGIPRFPVFKAVRQD